MYTWKCHTETSCVAILNKNVFFFKNEDKNRSCLGVGISGGIEDIRKR
jgi:hypothetical protein